MRLGLRGPPTTLIVPADISRNGNAVTVATGLARDEWVGVPAQLIQASLPGKGGHEVDQSVFAANGTGLPAPDDARRFAREMARWRDMPPDAQAWAASMYRPDLHAAAASLLPKI